MVSISEPTSVTGFLAFYGGEQTTATASGPAVLLQVAHQFLSRCQHFSSSPIASPNNSSQPLHLEGMKFPALAPVVRVTAHVSARLRSTGITITLKTCTLVLLLTIILRKTSFVHFWYTLEAFFSLLPHHHLSWDSSPLHYLDRRRAPQLLRGSLSKLLLHHFHHPCRQSLSLFW